MNSRPPLHARSTTPASPRRPLVSVITATRQRAERLEEAAGVVAAQTFSDWEWIVVDDLSTDRTPEVLERLARQEPRLRALRGAGRGVSAARNVALAAAIGRYIAFLDDDDGWLPEKMAAQVAYLDAHPAVALVYTRAEARYDDGRRCVVPRTQTPAETLEALLASDVIMHSSVMVRRATLETVGGFDETMRAAEDYDLWLRIAARYRIACLLEPLTIYRACGSRSRERLCEDFTNQIATARRLLRETRHLPGRVRRRLRQKIALTAYRLTEAHRQAQEYGAAAAAFARAVRYDPLVGVAYQRHAGRRGSGILFALKPYAGIVYCFAQRLRQAFVTRNVRVFGTGPGATPTPRPSSPPLPQSVAAGGRGGPGSAPPAPDESVPFTR